jgi:L-rhamnose isomerase/sugar isomerase
MITRGFLDEHNAQGADRLDASLGYAVDRLYGDGVNADAVITEIARFTVAAPSAVFGPGDTYEQVDDAAALNALTGANRSVSLDVPCENAALAESLRTYANERGITFDTVNTFASLGDVEEAARKSALEHNIDQIELGDKLGSRSITVRLPDGMDHAGEANFRGQFERVSEALHEIHAQLPADWLMFVARNTLAPALYSSVNSDWGSALLLALATGERCRCVVDVGRQLPNTNVEQVVSRVAMTGRLGGVRFSDSINPFQLFLIFGELLDAGDGIMPELSYVIDAGVGSGDPIEGLIQSTDALQVALAQALCVRRDELADAQDVGDSARAAEVLHRAFRTDVRALVAQARLQAAAAIDPFGAYRASGYRARVSEARRST